MKTTRETQAFVNALSAWDNFEAIGRELAVSLDVRQEANFYSLVIGFNKIKELMTNGISE